ncbi:MAG: toxic anion resistance protein, partial [Deltaproteobacteria bacterium]|nr:toxic anion resistance protein [Deltaproteobacteria bacterium]
AIGAGFWLAFIYLKVFTPGQALFVVGLPSWLLGAIVRRLKPGLHWLMVPFLIAGTVILVKIQGIYFYSRFGWLDFVLLIVFLTVVYAGAAACGAWIARTFRIEAWRDERAATEQSRQALLRRAASDEQAVTELEALIETGQAPSFEVLVEKAAAVIDFGDPTMTLAYGADPMKAFADFPDNLLRRVRAKNAGPLGESLDNLLARVKSADLDAFTAKTHSFGSLPVLGFLFDSLERRMDGLQKLVDQVDAVAADLAQTIEELALDIKLLDRLFQINGRLHDDLSVCIAAGEKRLECARNTDLPRMQAEVEQGGAGMKAQEALYFADRLDRFERRLHDLRASRAAAEQSAAQIRLIQNNDHILAEKIQDLIQTAIPIWKKQMAPHLSRYRRQRAPALQKNASDASNDLPLQNAKTPEETSLGAARESARSALDVETLREVHNRLVSALEESLKITAEGRDVRRKAEKELTGVGENLRAELPAPAPALGGTSTKEK